MSRIIFLDIDGVLNDDQTYRRIQEAKRERTGSAVVSARDLVDVDAIVPEYVERLNRIIGRTSAWCVLSSSWRKARELGEIQRTLESCGFVGQLVDKTPEKFSYVPRHREIKWWLADRSHAKPDAFVILDDDQEAGVGLTEHYVHVPNGLQDEHVERAVRVLGGR